jgi:hypothetical protein
MQTYGIIFLFLLCFFLRVLDLLKAESLDPEANDSRGRSNQFYDGDYNIWDMTEAHNVSEARAAPILMWITEFVPILIQPRQWTMLKIIFPC